jgi:hypothetical protein
VELNEKAACRAFVVTALTERARTWWERLGFHASDPDEPAQLDLYLLTSEIEATLSAAAIAGGHLPAQTGSARLVVGMFVGPRRQALPGGAVRKKGVPQADGEARLACGSLSSACERPEGARWGGA